MELNIGDLVVCPSSGPHKGPRIGKIKRVNKLNSGQISKVVLVGYIDYPQEFPGGWFSGTGAWVRPIRKIKFTT